MSTQSPPGTRPGHEDATPWRDPELSPVERVDALIALMSLKEKIAQLIGVGTAPVDPIRGTRSLVASQAQIMAASRFGIPAQEHEECLTGFAAWQATVYPTPLCCRASFDPDLVEQMAGKIGRSMRAVRVHQSIVEPGDVELRFGRSSTETSAVVALRLVGEQREVGQRRHLVSATCTEFTREEARA